jgi:hypothetical protein
VDQSTTKLSEQASHLRPRPSDHVRTASPSYQWERLSDILPEIAPLLFKHWREVDWFDGALPLDPDWKRCLEYEQVGVLHVLTCRLDGRLIGYIFTYLLDSAFFSQKWATVQGFWLDPLHRAGWTGIKLFKENERGLRELGAKAISVEILLKIAKDRGTLGKILERLGYHPLGTLYAKVL